MPFSARLQTRIDADRKLQAARAQQDEEIDRLQEMRHETDVTERRELLSDVREAAGRARERVRPNITVELGGAAVVGWRISQHDFYDNVMVDYGRTRDIVTGAYDPGGPEPVEMLVGLNELIIEQNGELWRVHHNAYRLGAHPPAVPYDKILDAQQLTEDNFQEWTTDIVAQTTVNFIENNHLDRQP